MLGITQLLFKVVETGAAVCLRNRNGPFGGTMSDALSTIAPLSSTYRILFGATVRRSTLYSAKALLAINY